MTMIGRFTLLICLLLLTFSSIAQPYSVTGRIQDATDTSTLVGVTVLITNTADTSGKNGGITDADGNFEIDGLANGNYSMRLDYVGYKSVTRAITVAGQNLALGTIKMAASTTEIKGATVVGKQIRAEQNGDTTSFHADSYKTNPDATAEDLVTKMPGVTSDNSGVKVNGEAVQQVYVDGKPFFGTDPTLALRNLPSEVIDKIQVFDKLSDQATFTGFDDGNAQKTINIITKKNKSEGVFGKVYAAGGTDNTYLAGGNLNIFNGDQRISILGLSNNINQQNFGSQDLLGISGGSGGGRGGGGGRGAFGGGGGGSNNFLVNQQNGITTTNSAGINYSDNWGKKVKVTGSYFFNSTDNVNNTSLTRNYFTPGGGTNGSVYKEADNTETVNVNHRFNLRLEYNIDSFNSIIFTPGISYQENTATNGQAASTFPSADSLNYPISNTINRTKAYNSGYSSSNNLLIQHKFKKPRRTVSLNVNSSLNEKIGNGSYFATDTTFVYDGGPDSVKVLDQHYTQYNNSYTVGGNLTYTEPIGKKGQLMANYYPSYTKSIADKETFNKDGSSGLYSILDDTLSNKYNSTYNVQKGGLSYRIGDKKFNFMAGANVQYATLQGNETYPEMFNLQKNFTDVLPIMFFNYRFSDGRNLRIMYRTNTTSPSITQLQDVVDVSNPLLMNTGNRNLVQDYEQTVIVRYGLTKAKTARNFFVYVYGNIINNYIANRTYLFTKAGTFAEPGTGSDAAVSVTPGSQLTMPVNLNGYYNTRAFLTYGMPLDIVKSNLNFNGGFSYTRSPGELNTVTSIAPNPLVDTGNKINYSSNYVPSFGIVLSSNVSENLDFTLSYSGNYNIINNTIQTGSGNNNYYSHVAGFKINYIFLKHFVINTSITHNYYTAFSSTGDQSFFLWNGYVAYKLLKKQALEARLTAFDILNQNKSITRTVTGTYVENDITNVLKQYFMFQLTYTIRNFKGGMTMPTTPEGDGGGGFRGHGPGGPGGPGGGGPPPGQ